MSKLESAFVVYEQSTSPLYPVMLYGIFKTKQAAIDHVSRFCDDLTTPTSRLKFENCLFLITEMILWGEYQPTPEERNDFWKTQFHEYYTWDGKQLVVRPPNELLPE